MNQLIENNYQRILDSFSVGRIREFKLLSSLQIRLNPQRGLSELPNLLANKPYVGYFKVDRAKLKTTKGIFLLVSFNPYSVPLYRWQSRKDFSLSLRDYLKLQSAEQINPIQGNSPITHKFGFYHILYKL
jgi:hypothetical protein